MTYTVLVYSCHRKGGVEVDEGSRARKRPQGPVEGVWGTVERRGRTKDLFLSHPSPTVRHRGRVCLWIVQSTNVWSLLDNLKVVRRFVLDSEPIQLFHFNSSRNSSGQWWEFNDEVDRQRRRGINPDWVPLVPTRSLHFLCPVRTKNVCTNRTYEK